MNRLVKKLWKKAIQFTWVGEKTSIKDYSTVNQVVKKPWKKAIQLCISWIRLFNCESVGEKNFDNYEDAQYECEHYAN